MLVLASGSPQRRAILEQLGVRFEAVPVNVDELTDGQPEALVVENALRKARAASGEVVLGVDTEVVLGVDTEVVVDGRVQGKPRDETHARSMLQALSGRPHEVWSGLALRRAGRERTAAVRTVVRFRALGEREVGWYLATGEWHDRAGAYAIQGRGAALVDGIEGDYLNVVGLPATALIALAPELVLGGPESEPGLR